MLFLPEIKLVKCSRLGKYFSVKVGKTNSEGMGGGGVKVVTILKKKG